MRLPGGGACAVRGHWPSGGGVSGPCPSPRRATVHPPPSRWLPTGSPTGVSPPRAAAAVFLPSHFFPIFLFFFCTPSAPVALVQTETSRAMPPLTGPPQGREAGGACGAPGGGGWAAAPSPAAGTSCPRTPDRSSWVPGLSWGADRGCSPGLPIGAQASPSVWPASPPCARLGLGPGPGRTGTWAAGSQCRPRSFRPASGQRKHVPSQGRRVLSPGPLGTLRSQEGLLEVASAALFLEDGNGWGQAGGGRRVRVEPGQRAGHQCARGQWGPWCVARGTRPA